MENKTSNYVTMGVWPSSKKQFLRNAVEREMTLVEYFDWLVQRDKMKINPNHFDDQNTEPINI